jgi:hypothetical protein
MADNVIGGLGSVMPQEEAPAAPSAKPNVDDYVSRVQRQQEESFKALDERRKRLLELSGSRKNQTFDPQLLALSAALARPTKTGSFGESLGYAAEALGTEQERQLQREQADAKLELELEQATQEQKRRMLGDQFLMSMTGGQRPPTAPAAPMGNAPMPSAPMGNAPMGGAPSAPTAAPVDQGGLDSLTDNQLAVLARSNPELYQVIQSITENRRKREESNLKRREVESKEQSIKRFLPGVGSIEMPITFWNEISNAKDFSEIEKIYQKNNLPLNLVDKPDGGKRFMTAEEIDLQKEEKKAKLTEEPKKYVLPEVGAGTYELLPTEYRARNEARSKSLNALQQWWDKNHPEFNVKIRGATVGGTGGAGNSISPEAPESSEAREVRVAKEKKLGENKATSEVKNRDEIINNAKVADRLAMPAEVIYKLGQDPVRAKAFGLLEQSDIASAFAGVIAEGARIGSYNVGIPAIRDAVAKMSGGNQAEANKIMDTLQTLAKNYSILELNMTRMYLQGEGAITEGERGIVRNISGGVGTRLNVAMAQSEMFMQRSAFDKLVKQELLKWEKSNPNKSFDEFSESPQYKQIFNQFNGNMDKLYNKYYGNPASTPAAPARAPASSSETLPAAAARQVVEGQITTFANGQQWTRRNGQPVKVK